MSDIEELLRSLSSVDNPLDRKGIGQLTAVGPDAVDLLIPYLRHQDTTLCAMAAMAVGMLYPEERYSSAAKMLKGPSQKDRAMQVACKRALPHLEAMVERGDVRLTLHACETMRIIGGQDGYVVFWLTWALVNADSVNHLWALGMLDRLGKNACPAVPALVKCLAADDKKVSLRSASVLGGLGKAASEAIPILETWLTSDDQRMRVTGAYAIAKISKSTSVLPVLIKAVEAPEMMDDEMWGYNAIDLLGKLGSVARSAVPDLERLRAHDSKFVRDRAKRALKKIRDNAEEK